MTLILPPSDEDGRALLTIQGRIEAILDLISGTDFDRFLRVTRQADAFGRAAIPDLADRAGPGMRAAVRYVEKLATIRRIITAPTPGGMVLALR